MVLPDILVTCRCILIYVSVLYAALYYRSQSGPGLSCEGDFKSQWDFPD